MSPRRKRIRRVESPPVLKGFKPFGIPNWFNDQVLLHFEEYEALQLVGYKNLSQEFAANIMNVSRPTFTRIYNSGLKKILEALAEGKSVMINGGDVYFDKDWYKCYKCQVVFTPEENKNPICINCQSENLEHINKTIEEWQLGKYKGE
ncbi:MAG: DUF134 domain-containing protein [Thiohalospira sp.]